MTRNQFIVGAAALALTAQAQAAHARIAYVCPQLSGSELSVRVDSGCISSSARNEGHTLALEVDQNTATIRVSGTILFSSAPIQTADCAGRSSITLTADDIEARRYTVLLNDRRLGLADFVEDRGSKACLGTRRTKFGSFGENMATPNSHRDWDDNPVDGWAEWRGASVLGLLSPLLDSHPEGMEGRATTEISIQKMRWHSHIGSLRNPIDRAPFYGVTITQHGYLDDSVSGGRYFAEVRMGEDGQWNLDGLWSQQMCARGAKAGQWTNKPCI